VVGESSAGCPGPDLLHSSEMSAADAWGNLWVVVHAHLPNLASGLGVSWRLGAMPASAKQLLCSVVYAR